MGATNLAPPAPPTPARSGCISIDAGVIGVVAAVFLVLVEWRWPQLIPIRLNQFWHWGLGGPWQQIAGDVWPIFAVGAAVCVVGMLLKLDKVRELAAELEVAGCAWLPVQLLRTPILAAWEEFLYRWLLFYAFIAACAVADSALRLVGLGVVEAAYTHVVGPIADFFTLHKVHFALFGPWGWTVGAAVILANGRFRRDHAYQGVLGLIWSWFVGMGFSLVVFRYGILAAILVHTVYNYMAYGIWAIGATLARPTLPHSHYDW
jgi:hypothetical protein